jgi:hypothetical protein
MYAMKLEITGDSEILYAVNRGYIRGLDPWHKAGPHSYMGAVRTQ